MRISFERIMSNQTGSQPKLKPGDSKGHVSGSLLTGPFETNRRQTPPEQTLFRSEKKIHE